MRIGTKLAVAALAPLMMATSLLAQQDNAQVQTRAGAVQGVREGDVIAWKGLPFAAPPVGELRWRAPQPVARWSGVRSAAAYGYDCMQAPFPDIAAPPGAPSDEDCLYINVWRPAAAKGKLPVLVWIHGGGFVNGGSSASVFAGSELARKGLLVASFNYRLGRFGTFAHPALTKADADRGLLGNYGFLDQVAALKWLRANIAAFGGDAGNITLMGESAGGRSVHWLITSPLTKGMFRRAIIMSGGDGGGERPSLAAAESTGLYFAETKGIAPDDPQALVKLRALSADQVTDGLNMVQLYRPGKRSFSAPYSDGRITVVPTTAYASSVYRPVPMMIGATSADSGGNTGPMIAGARTLAGQLAERGAAIYEYRFSYVAESIAKPGAPHASDVPFFFGTQRIRYGAATTSRDDGVGQTISSYVANFAKTGDPNDGVLPAWPRYDRAQDVLMEFTTGGKAVAIKDPVAPAQ